MRFRNILDCAVFFILGFFMLVKFRGTGRIIGLLIIAVGVVLLIIMLKDSGSIKKRIKKSEKDEIDKRDAERIRRAEEIEKLEKYDVDSGLDYCAHCGNYSAKDGICEVCGEKVTE